jgi:hypothetical protein
MLPITYFHICRYEQVLAAIFIDLLLQFSR